MPLKKGRTRAIIAENVKEMQRAGYSRDQAVAAAMRQAGEPDPKPRKAVRTKALSKPKGQR